LRFFFGVVFFLAMVTLPGLIVSEVPGRFKRDGQDVDIALLARNNRGIAA
jgi:hypothetical protein